MCTPRDSFVRRLASAEVVTFDNHGCSFGSLSSWAKEVRVGRLTVFWQLVSHSLRSANGTPQATVSASEEMSLGNRYAKIILARARVILLGVMVGCALILPWFALGGLFRADSIRTAFGRSRVRAR